MPRMKSVSTGKYTAVQHSGAGYRNVHTFSRGLEPRSLSSVKDVSTVVKAGGMIFNDYGSASDYCMKEQYPPTVTGLVPQAPGRFSSSTIDGLRIYVPATGAKP